MSGRPTETLRPGTRGSGRGHQSPDSSGDGSLPGRERDDLRRDSEEAQRALRLFEIAGVLMVALDPRGRVTAINPAGAEILGRERAEILGADWIESFVPGRIRADVRRVFDSIMEGQLDAYASVEGRVLCADGEERVLFWENTTIRDDSGRVTGTLSCGTDITERKAAQAALAESKERFRTMFEACPDAIFVERPDGTILDVNEAACTLHDATHDRLIGANVQDLVPPGHRAVALDDLAGLVEGRIDLLESYSWSADGRSIPVEIRARQIQYDGADAILLSVRDVSERKEAERIRDQFLDRAGSILNLIPDAVLTVDAEGGVKSANPAAESMFGLQAAELECQSIADLLSASHFEQSESAVDFRADEPDAAGLQVREMTARSRDGSLFPVEVLVRRMDDFDGGRLLLVVRDISARRSLERDVLRISEDERQRIGQDIHDHLASRFSGLTLMGRGLLNKLRNDPDYRVETDMIEYIIEQARTGADEARTLARGLNPVKLEERGLEAALRELTLLAEKMSNATCDLSFASEIPDLEPPIASQLYRIAHEAVTNAMKHADADRIDITLERSKETLALKITDNGSGITDTVSASDGMGIHIMKYRTGVIHGSISIDSVPGEGTTVVCRVPI